MATLDVNVQVIAPVIHATSVQAFLNASYTAPLEPGTVLSSIVVAPGNWDGTLSLSGPDASKVAISNRTLVVGPVAITNPANLQFTITATP